MTEKTYYYTASSLFTLVALVHLVRAIQEWELVVSNVMIPIWVSWVVAVLVGYLAVRGFTFVTKN